MELKELKTALKIGRHTSSLYLATREHVQYLYIYVIQYRKVNRELRREVERLREENECLKKRIEIMLKD